MYTHRANLHEQIAESQKILREKFKKFKKGEYDIEDGVSKTFKPIIEPLNKLVENSNSVNNKRAIIRHSTPDFENYSEIDNDNDSVISENQKNKTFNVSEDSSSSPNNLFDSNQESNILEFNNPEITDDLSNNEQIKGEITVPKVDTEKLVNRYMNFVKRNDKHKVDHVLGVRKLVRGLRLGNSSFTYNKKLFRIRGDVYKITPGLTELIFNKNPNDYLITPKDQEDYRNIILTTNAHKKRYKSNNSIRTNIGDKYMKYVEKSVNGNGFKIARKNDITEYVYWDDPNELVDRLKLLDGERAAGNNNHDNEIQNILEELSERGYIT